MSIYPCAILVPDEHFIVLTTLSRRYGRSTRFLISREALAAFVAEDQGHLYDHDLSRFLVLYRSDETTVDVQISWLRSSGNDQLSGRLECFELPLDILRAALDQPVRYLADNAVYQCPVLLSPSAHKMFTRLDHQERRALSKALRDSFHWRHRENITLYADWNKDFCFRADLISGGLCRHEDEIIGRDGKLYHRIKYSVHT